MDHHIHHLLFKRRIMESNLNYGNWIRRKILIILGSCALISGALSIVPFGTMMQVIFGVLSGVMLLSFLFPLYSYVMFSQKGGKIQDKVYNLIIIKLGILAKNSNILDIGSGNGVLAVKLALNNPESTILGVDYWGKNWEYSKRVCDRNAQLAQVQDRVSYQKGDAAKLDFVDSSFDGLTSNLTFHEVQSVKDKREVVKEALRVLKPGGSFSFVDYFYESKYYGKPTDLVSYLGDLGITQFELRPLKDMLVLPILLKDPKNLGRVGILYGKK
jgi:SAM-dependent methyltransferase